LSILAVSLCAQQTADTIIFSKFQKFMAKFNKQYKTIDEFTQKFAIFKDNFIAAAKLVGKKSYKVGVTKFFDMTPAAFKKTFRNLKFKDIKPHHAHQVAKLDMTKPTPAAFDWRTKGAVGVIKDQGQCGSCWAFAAVGNIEGQDFIAHKTLQNFAEQQIVDCDVNGNDQGCSGGLPEGAFAYVQQQGGLMLTADYPYTATDSSDGDTCNFDQTKVHVQLNGYNFAPSTDEGVIATFLFQTGPLAIGINATPFQTYTSGIIDEDANDCDPTELDHGVTIVGYGTNSSQIPYWIIKNSWGADWGEQGYVRVRRGTGCCGVNTHVLSSTVV